MDEIEILETVKAIRIISSTKETQLWEKFKLEDEASPEEYLSCVKEMMNATMMRGDVPAGTYICIEAEELIILENDDTRFAIYKWMMADSYLIRN